MSALRCKILNRTQVIHHLRKSPGLYILRPNLVPPLSSTNPEIPSESHHKTSNQVAWIKEAKGKPLQVGKAGCWKPGSDQILIKNSAIAINPVD